MTGRATTRCRELHPGIYRIILPLAGKKPGPVNAYLFTGSAVTLVDTGTLKAFPVLQQALAGLGMACADIDQIILTHGHIDHYGAARKIMTAAGGDISILAHEEDRTLVEHGLEVPRLQFIRYYRLMGVPLIFQLSLQLVQWIFSSMAEPCRISTFIADGDTVSIGDYEATVIETPGHTRGSISLYIEKEGILFPGDHILGHITPNAFVMLETDFVLPRRMSQVEFYESLRKIEEISPRIVYPAHGEPIEDVGKTIAMFREQFLLRQDSILSMLATGEFTVYEIGRKLFPDIRGKRLPLEIFLMVSEVYTHLQVLEKDNIVTSRLENGAIYYGKTA
jgi:glyoxylase-like metal-dependent hydrolase (beta-lactamase superfamily II)